MIAASEHHANAMPWDIFIRPPVVPTLPALNSGEELVTSPPPLHRSQSSLERAMSAMSSAVLDASRSWVSWRDIWRQKPGVSKPDPWRSDDRVHSRV